MSKRQTTNVLLASLMMSFTTGIVHGEDHPFVFVDLPLPATYTIDADSQVDINFDGDVLATLLVSGSVSELAVWKDDDYAFTPVDPEMDYDTVIARQINDAGFVVGDIRHTNSGDVFAFVWNPDTDVYTISPLKSSAFDLNNDPQPDSVGLREAGSLPVAVIDGVPEPLKGLDGTTDTATCALGIDPNHSSKLWIAGVSETAPMTTPLHAVIWDDVDAAPYDLTPAGATTDQVAWQVSTLGDVIGYKVDGSGNPDEGFFWEKGTGETWTQETLTNIVRPWGLNTFGEVVGDGSTATEAWLRVKSPNPAGEVLIALHDAVGVPDGVIHSFRVSSISDAGEIAGVIDYTPLGSTPRTVVPFKLVPYNVDNDTGGTATTGPDYRQVIDEESEGSGDWIPDAFEGMRVGLHAPHIGARALDDVTAVRFLRDNMQIEAILESSLGECEVECDGLTAWGTGVDSNSQKEIIITIRVPYGMNPDQNRMPPLPSGQNEVIESIREFCQLFGNCFDYAQLGNEIWRGNGSFYVEVPGCGQGGYSGPFNGVPELCKDAAADEVFGWLARQIDAARDGSALAGRPLRIIGPALTNAVFGEASTHDCDLNRPSWGVKSIIEFCDEQRVPLDVHYHFNVYETDVEAIVPVVNGAAECWTRPQQGLVTLEYGIQATHTWWDPKSDDIDDLMDSDCNTHAVIDSVVYETWEELMTFWLADDAVAPPLGGIKEAFDLFDAAGNSYLIACYAPTEQTGMGQSDFVHFGAISPTMVTQDLNPGCGVPLFYEPWRTEFETASFAHMLTGFTPHNEDCDCSPCPENQ